MEKKKHIFRTLCLFLFIIICTSPNIFAQKKNKDPYINNDSLAVYSTHSSRPFKYGYPYTKEECEKRFRIYLTNYGIKNGDVIADVGAASGWLDGVFSVLTDSVTFYIQDIDTHLLNPVQFEKVIAHFTKERASPQTNQFFFVIGNQTQTNLPDSTFDKIILNNTFHEIKNTPEILSDLANKLKKNGKLIIQEDFSNAYKTIRHKGCNIKAYRASDVISMLQKEGFYLTHITEPENAFNNYLTFEKDMIRSNAFYQKKDSLELYIREMNRLNEKKVSKDSMQTRQIAIYIQENMDKILHLYHTVEHYIDDIGYMWLYKKQYKNAINILKMNLLLYPESSNVYDSLGEIYLLTKNYELALTHYTKSLELDPENKNAEEMLSIIKYYIDLE